MKIFHNSPSKVNNAPFPDSDTVLFNNEIFRSETEYFSLRFNSDKSQIFKRQRFSIDAFHDASRDQPEWLLLNYQCTQSPPVNLED